MGKTFKQLSDTHVAFIEAQKLFFVATAPLGADGHVNLSPKGYDSLIVENPHTVLWADLGGSGVETIAHLRENGRITMMFCAFEGSADILRLYGRGEAICLNMPGFDELLARFPQFDRARAIIRVSIDRVSSSCGWGVPFFAFEGERDQLRRWVEKEPVPEWSATRLERNVHSIDGLPGLVDAEENES